MRYLAILGLLALLVSPAVAQESMEDLMLRRIAWIVEHTDLEYNGEPLPALQHIPRENIQNIAGLSAIATYRVEINTIYFVEGLELGTDDGETTLVHELVHYLQALDGRDDTKVCGGLLEPEAYETEARWADAHGIPAPDYDAFRVITGMSACRMRGVHP